MALMRSERTALIWTIGFLTFGGLLKAHQAHEVRWGQAFLAPPPSDLPASVQEMPKTVGSPRSTANKEEKKNSPPSQYGDSAVLVRQQPAQMVDSAIPDGSALGTKALPGPTTVLGCPVSLNEATSTQLTGLPGIGAKMAEKIVAYRQEHGRFRKVTDLDRVKGIGQKKLDRIRSCLIL